jgi:CSLREA domain-containing protein
MKQLSLARERLHWPSTLCSSVALALALLATYPVAAANFVVTDTTDRVDTNPGDGNCQTTIFTCSLRAAIQEANAFLGADDVTVPAGVYTLTITGADEDGAASGDLDITEEVDIFGAGMEQTILDGNETDRVFHVLAGLVTIGDMTIRNGRADLPTSSTGGGILVDFSGPGTFDLERVEMTGNVANAGGGMRNLVGVVDIVNSVFSDNEAADLGFTNAQGGAVLANGDTDIVGTTLVGNKAGLQSAGVHGAGSPDLSIRNSTFRDNQGTAVFTNNSNVDLVNVTISGNAGFGLDYFSFDGTDSLSVKNSILADNSTDCQFRGTTPTDLDFAGEHNLDSDGSCPLNGLAGDLPLTDPQLGPLLPNGGTSPTLVPLVGSPVIDSGNDETCEADDQRGAMRPLDGDGVGGAVCDIGAVEVLPCIATPDVVLQNDEITTTEDFAACFTLTAGPAFTIAAPGDVTFRARNAIVLRNGFSVIGGPVAFRAILDPAAGSGIVLP